MTKNITITIDQIEAAAAELARHTLAAGKYREKDTDDGVTYYVYHLTYGQKAKVAFAVNLYIDGRLDKLDVCGVSQPKGFIATEPAWTIARRIIMLAERIIDEVNGDELDAAVAEFQRTKANLPSPHPRSLAARN